MKLTEAEKDFIHSAYHEDDKGINQMETVMNCIVCEYCGKRISLKTACDLLGREKVISVVHRAAFHRTGSATAPDGNEVYFDVNKFFKRS